MFAIKEIKSGLYVSETHLENPSKGHFFKWCETDKYRKKLFDTLQSATNMVEALSMDRKSGASYKVVKMSLEEISSIKPCDVKKSVRVPCAKYAIRNPKTGMYINAKLEECELEGAKLFAMIGPAAEFIKKQNDPKYSNYDIVRFALKVVS